MNSQAFFNSLADILFTETNIVPTIQSNADLFNNWYWKTYLDRSLSTKLALSAYKKYPLDKQPLGHLEQCLDLGGHLAGAGELYPELVGVGRHQASGGDVHCGGPHGRAGGLDERQPGGEGGIVGEVGEKQG